MGYATAGRTRWPTFTRSATTSAHLWSGCSSAAARTILPLLAGVAYGSPEYEALVQRMGAALEHHYRANSHHPEHHGAARVAGMDLFDVVEMVCDWIASAARNPGDGVKLDYNVKLFGIEPQLASIIANTLQRWPRR